MRNKGFTLVEMMLVAVIVSVLLMLGIGYSQQKLLAMQTDRAAMQMQQMLNAALTYYVNNGVWPGSNIPPASTSALTDLQTSQGYLPSGTIKSPWGTTYSLSVTDNVFYVSMGFPSSLKNQDALAKVMAGKLPLAKVVAYTPPPQTCSWGVCTDSGPAVPASITAAINIPGQDLNNASAVNYAGLYHHGGCVPVPTCPTDATNKAMQPQVFVVPVSVSGLNDTNTTNVYPISSFTAYATTAKTSPDACTNGTALACAGSSPSGQFWRACLQIVTERGDVSTTNTGSGAQAWGKNVTVAAFTRCQVQNEPTGSGFDVFTR